MGKNIDSLGIQMDARMKDVFNRSFPWTLNLGKITSNGGLKIDSIGNVIPRGSYMVNVNFLNTEEESVSTTNVEGHYHKVTIPSQNKGLSTGDRVLVAWVGNEPIVVAVVTSS